MLKIAMIAGEASGDMLAASLIAEIKQQYPGEIEFVGIGGTKMQTQGFNSWHQMETLSVMGYLEVIKSLPALLKLRHQILAQLLSYQPDVFIGVDAPDFNFYLEHKLKQAGIKTVHYISPTIWAWRYKRIYKIKRSTDLMLCIFPFEEAIYQREGIAAKFVGHPLAKRIPNMTDTQQARKTLNLADNLIIYTILVGSRIREINSLANTLIATCNLISQQLNQSFFIFPFANEKTLHMMSQELAQAEINFKYRLILNNTPEALQASDYVIAKSGTVSLEAALYKKPMLICYKVHPFTAWLLSKKIKIPYVGQPNIIAGKEIVKEFLQEQANPQAMSEYMLQLHYDAHKREQMIAEFNQLHRALKQEASVAAAKAILELCPC